MLTRQANPAKTFILLSILSILILVIASYLLNATLADVQVSSIKGLTGDCYTNNEDCFAHNFAMLSSVIFCGFCSIVPALMVADQKGLL